MLTHTRQSSPAIYARTGTLYTRQVQFSISEKVLYFRYYCHSSGHNAALQLFLLDHRHAYNTINYL